MKKSFTMIELIFVIVVLAIVAGGTFEFILRIYQSYARVRTVDTLQTELDLALTQISNRLAYRIKDSLIYGGFPVRELTSDIGVQQDILEWISYDREGLMGMWNGSDAVVPGWSGFSDRNLMVDIDGASRLYQIRSLGSNLNYANEIIKSLSYGDVDLTNNRVALIIPGNDTDIKYGWYGEAGNNAFIVNCSSASSGSCTNLNDDTFTYSSDDPEYNTDSDINFDFADRNDTDRYYLAWSAYALVRNSDRNLTLYYNYQPWSDTGANQYDNGAKSTILLQNVTRFNFKQQGNTIWIKICMDSKNEDKLSLKDDSDYGFCKERVIY